MCCFSGRQYQIFCFIESREMSTDMEKLLIKSSQEFVKGFVDFLEQEDIDVLPWCARSPDLCPIEHVWNELGRRVSRRDNPPVNRPTLIAALQEEWDNLPQGIISNLIGSMRRRCTACLQARGGHTGY